MLRTNATPSVANDDLGHATDLGDRDGHLGLRTAVDQGVIDEVGDDHLAETSGNRDVDFDRCLEVDHPSPSEPPLTGLVNHAIRHVCDIDHAVGNREPSTVECRQQQHLIDQAAHAVNLVLNLLHELLALVLEVGQRQRLGKAENAGQRRAELVRDSRGERPARLIEVNLLRDIDEHDERARSDRSHDRSQRTGWITEIDDRSGALATNAVRSLDQLTQRLGPG